MTTTITIGASDYIPLRFLDYGTAGEGRNQFDSLLNGTEVVEERAGGSRTGTFRALFANADIADASALEAGIRSGATITIADTDHPHIDMDCKLAGRVALRLEPNYRHWIVSWDFKELT